MAPPTITPSSGVVAAVFSLVVVLVVVVVLVLESVVPVVLVPVSEQELTAAVKTNAVAKAKIGLRVIFFWF